MLCYSFLEKRGDYIKKLINWRLLEDEKVIINNNIECEYEINKFIKYEEDQNIVNIINLHDQIYIRNSDEFILKIDFKKALFSYTLKENNLTLENTIDCNFQKKDKAYILTYKLNEEVKKIIIQLL